MAGVSQLMIIFHLGSVVCWAALPSVERHYPAYQFNATVLSTVLRRLDYLNLHLRSADEAANNDMVHFLLRQTQCPLRLTVGHDEKEAGFFQLKQRHRALVMSSRALNATLRRYAFRSGIFLCVLWDEPVAYELLDFAHEMWIERGLHRVYYISPKQQVFYNPFIKQQDADGDYGALVVMDGSRTRSVFRNLNGYPIRTYIFDSVYSTVYGNATLKQLTSVEGADAKAGELLSQKMNFTVQLQWPDDDFFGARLDNGSYNGAIGRMLRYETDIVLSGFFVKDYLTKEVEFSVSVYMDELCCYVMKAKRIPQSILPLFAVGLDAWLSFLLVGTISPLVWMCMRRWNLSFGDHSEELDPRTRLSLATNSQYVRIYIDTWVVWVRVNIGQFPPFLSERLFVISLCLVSVIFGALFESSLATVYIRPLYYKDINTLQELDEANFRIYIKHAAMKDDLFYGHSSSVYQNLNTKLFLVGETEERLISMMSKRGGFAAVTRAASLNLNDIRYFITKKIYKIPECPKNYHIAYMMPQHSPYEKSVNLLLLRFLSAGLFDLWIGEMKHKAKISIHNFPDYNAEAADRWKVLTLKDLQLSFYALIFGCTLAILAQLGEYVLCLKCRRKINPPKRNRKRK